MAALSAERYWWQTLMLEPSKLEMFLGLFESHYLDLSMCMIVLKALFTSHSYYLLYYLYRILGFEWFLQNSFSKNFASFHNRCVRGMCRINRMQTRLFQINTSELLHRLSLISLTDWCLLFSTKLHWVGHVMRMPWDYLPRKVISSWIRSKRPKGYPNLTYGWSQKKSLEKADINSENWHVLFLDHDGWRDVINNIPLVYE